MQLHSQTLFCPRRWAKEAVSPTVVQAVLNAWEMERHHAAERHLYPEMISALQEIKRNHPDVIIGAVTDGRANPLFMTFTLAPYFDFCLSWEDDQASRRKFFQDLGKTEGKEDLKWIYDAALEKYQELSAAKMALSNQVEPNPNKIWIHCGDDLAYDVGGSAQSGAKTIYLELAEKYGQTARQRVDQPNVQPSWSTTPKEELEKRRSMNEVARGQVDATVNYLSRLPEAIQDIIDKENERLSSSGSKSAKEEATSEI
jgi:FMN phosphatase YigB (HAD superfamily)